MATHLILFKQLGENSDTPHDPSRVADSVEGTTVVLVDGTTVDLREQTTCCLNSGDNRLVSKDLYSIKRVTLPDWMTPEEWLRNRVEWKYFWGMHKVAKTLPEDTQRKLRRMGSKSQLACLRLLKTKSFRSNFRQSLRNQLDAWLEGSSDHASPFSPRQWDCLLNTYLCRDAESISTSLYRSRSTWCTPVESVA